MLINLVYSTTGTCKVIRIYHGSVRLIEQEDQVALNRSPEFCLKLTYRYLVKAGQVPVDTWGEANFGPRGIIRTNLVEIHYVMLHT